jgi:RNA polymerase sigma-70 factor, ECF subfamily
VNRPEAENLTELLIAWSDGEEQALELLAPVLHSELRRLARRFMMRERDNHVLQTSALINEAYLRLIDWKNVRWQNRAHFFGAAAGMMRRILVDFARTRPKIDAATEVKHVSLEEAIFLPNNRDRDLIALDEALQSLAKLDQRKARIVEMKFFGGLNVEEIAEILHISPVTVMREWKKAKAWLYNELSNG